MLSIQALPLHILYVLFVCCQNHFVNKINGLLQIPPLKMYYSFGCFPNCFFSLSSDGPVLVELQKTEAHCFLLSTLSLPYTAVLEVLLHYSAPFRRAETLNKVHEDVLFSMWECKCKVWLCFVNYIFDLKYRFYVMDSAYTTCAMWSQYNITIHYEKSYIYMVLLCPLFLPSYRLIIIYWRKENNIRLALYVVLFMFQ